MTCQMFLFNNYYNLILFYVGKRPSSRPVVKFYDLKLHVFYFKRQNIAEKLHY